jgi:glycosyltransferase involved in cell wall biosynthesis
MSAPKKQLRVLQVNTLDHGGGAERVAWMLFEAYRERGLDSWLAVGKKFGDDPRVLRVADFAQPSAWTRGWGRAEAWMRPRSWRLSRLLAAAAEPGRWRDTARGLEDFRHPGAWRLPEMTPAQEEALSEPPDIIHCHNLHGGYFDLRALPRLSRQIPLVLTLHDAWLLSGHCAHSFDCERWRTGCGHCPDLTIPPAIPRDATAENWARKQRIFAESRLFVSAPSRWLLEKAQSSILAPAIAEARVIPNGVDLSVFHPADRAAARAELGLPPDARVLLFTAHGIRENVWKDYRLLREAVAIVAERLRGEQILFLALGEEAPEETVGAATIRFVPFQPDPAHVARYYQAADVYLHAARVENFPNTVLEALACGTPAVATAVGGIPEQLEHEVSGLLTPPGDAAAFAEAVVRVLIDADLYRILSQHAPARAAQFDLNRQVDAYLEWYRAILGKVP